MGACVKKTFLAGLLGGLVVFVWGSFSHTVLPLGTLGLSSLTNEAPLVAALQQSGATSGWYLLPGVDLNRPQTADEEKAWLAKYRSGPNAFLIYNAQGTEAISPARLGSELASNIAAALIGAFVLRNLAGGLCRRAGMVALLGLFGWLSLCVSLGIWYRFPGAFLMGSMIDELISWFLAGLAMAWVLKRLPATSQGTG